MGVYNNDLVKDAPYFAENVTELKSERAGTKNSSHQCLAMRLVHMLLFCGRFFVCVVACTFGMFKRSLNKRTSSALRLFMVRVVLRVRL